MGSDDIPLTARTAASWYPFIEHHTPLPHKGFVSRRRCQAHPGHVARAAWLIDDVYASYAGKRVPKSVRSRAKKVLLLQYRHKASRWDKPIMLGSSDLELTPRSMAAAGITPPKKTPRFTAKDLTPDEAATHLQGVWRARIARRKMRKLLSKQYEKVWDSNTQKFYYINKKTGAVGWKSQKRWAQMTSHCPQERQRKRGYHTSSTVHRGLRRRI